MVMVVHGGRRVERTITYDFWALLMTLLVVPSQLMLPLLKYHIITFLEYHIQEETRRVHVRAKDNEGMQRELGEDKIIRVEGDQFVRFTNPRQADQF